MKRVTEISDSKKRSANGSAQNGRSVNGSSNFYGPKEKMSKADSITLKAWKKTFENRELFLDIVKS